MARRLTSTEGIEIPWDDKVKEGQRTKPLTKEEFLSLHVGIWGSLEFCRLCYKIVYNGECSGCKEEDKGNSRYRVIELRNNKTGVSLVDQHLKQIRAQARGETLTDSTVGRFVEPPAVGRVRVGDLVQPAINRVEEVDIGPAQVPPLNNFIHFDANGNVIDPEPINDGDIGDGHYPVYLEIVIEEPANNVEEGGDVEHGLFDEELPMAEYHEPDEEFDNPYIPDGQEEGYNLAI